MSAIRTEPLPSLSSCKQCLEWSEDGTLAVMLENGLYVMRFGLSTHQKDYDAPMFTMKNADQVTLPLTIIPLEERVREYENGIPRPDYQAELLNESNSDFIELLWNRTLSPNILAGFSGMIVVRCCFSPHGADKFNRAIMCTLSVDHRTSLYSRGEDKKWKKVIDLCHLIYEKLDCEDFQSVSKRTTPRQHESKGSKLFNQAKDRSYAMGVMAMDWSHTLVDEKTGNKFAFLFGVTRSGHLVIWKINFPLTNSSSTRLVNFCDISVDHPSCVKWCQVDETTGLVMIGYTNGQVRLIVFCHSEDQDDLLQGEVVDLWKDEDHLTVKDFAWSKENNILFATKGPYVIAFKLKVKGKSLEAIAVSMQHAVVGCGSFHTQSACYKHPYLFLGNQEAVYQLSVDLSNGLKLNVEEIKVEDLEGPFRYDGMVVSPNRSVMVLCNSPSKRYCHLNVRSPTKLAFHILRPIEEICQIIIRMEFKSLDAIADHLMCVKQWALKEKKLPQGLRDAFCKEECKPSIDDPMLRLKVMLFVHHIERSVAIYEKLGEADANASIKKLEEIIQVKHCLESVLKLKRDMQIDELSIKEKKSAMVMCRWLAAKTDCVPENTLALIKTVQDDIEKSCEDPSSYEESCIICKKNVLVTSFYKDGCEKKHVFSRCSQTLLQVTTMKNRKCVNCHHIALELAGDASGFKWLTSPARIQCTYCDNLVT